MAGKKGSSRTGYAFLGAMLTGITSRSNETAKVHRLFRDGHASEKDFASAVKRDSDIIVASQKGFAFSSGGQLDWLDIMRPLALRLKGFATRSSAGEDAVGPVTRWFRTNTFYRKPLINGRIECKGGEMAGALPELGSRSVALMLAPYSFARLAENSFYESEGAMALDYARAIAKSSGGLLDKGYKCILLSDPSVGFEQSIGRFKEPEWYAQALSEAKASGMVLGVNFPLAQASSVAGLAEDSKVDFIGIDAVFSSNLKVKTGKDVLLGIVDGARAGVESQESIGRRLAEFIAGASFSGRYYIGPNDRLYDVPFETAIGKMQALSGFKGALYG